MKEQKIIIPIVGKFKLKTNLHINCSGIILYYLSAEMKLHVYYYAFNIFRKKFFYVSFFFFFFFSKWKNGFVIDNILSETICHFCSCAKMFPSKFISGPKMGLTCNFCRK